ncbi:MAG TPA: antitoxin AF2212-like protein, partial [Candidatus Acidoferrales bacterium]|nr:antitoxin AF2212-like protein [Candidatus Acidoferrales bacterium]
REMNREADALANVALDQGAGVRSEIRKEAAAGPRSAGNTPTDIQARASKPRRIRARFERGVLVPAEPLDLLEGATVILQIDEL